MASSLNKVFILGNLGGDPELRYTQNQTPVATFNVATTDVRTDQAGQKIEQTEWHRIVVWSKLAENCSKYLSKGRTVFVEGRLQTRAWEDKQGQKRSTTEIVAVNVQFIGGASQRDASFQPRQNQQGPGQSFQPQQQQQPQQGMQDNYFEAGGGLGGPDTPGLDDVPF